MTRIIEKCGVRYRRTGPGKWDGAPHGFGAHAGVSIDVPAFSEKCPEDCRCDYRTKPSELFAGVPPGHWEALPRIPDWPEGIGPAPQYLSDDPDTTLQRGDWVLLYWQGKHTIFEATGFQGLAQIQSGTENAWLLRRADPEADA